MTAAVVRTETGHDDQPLPNSAAVSGLSASVGALLHNPPEDNPVIQAKGRIERALR